jgi:bacterioferritin
MRAFFMTHRGSSTATGDRIRARTETITGRDPSIITLCSDTPRRHRSPSQSAISNNKEVAMKGDAKVLEYLNAQLKNELTAINQYFLHYRMLKNWGFKALAKHEYEESIEEMKHADRLMDRILMVEGLPNLQDLGKLMIGESAVEILHCDLSIEMGSVTTLKDAIAYCESVRDYVSRELLEDILKDTEEHVDHLETQIELVAKVGEQNWLQTQIGEVS